MDSHFTGPYEIIEEIEEGVYRLKNVKTQKVLAKLYNSMHFKEYYSQVFSETSENVDSNTPKRKMGMDESPEPESQMKRQCTSKSDMWVPELNLKIVDRKSIENNDYLNDRCMNAVSDLLRKQFPEMKGLQSTVVISSKEHCQSIEMHSDSV